MSFLGFVCFMILMSIVGKAASMLLKSSFNFGNNKYKRRKWQEESDKDTKEESFLKVVNHSPYGIENVINGSYLNNKKDWIDQQRRHFASKMSVITLLESKPIIEIGYKDLLNCFEWRFLREKILMRDLYKCNNCSLQSSKLHVHHKYYLKNFLPWEIEDSALITLCYSCHKKEHEEKDIKVVVVTTTCLVQATNSNLYCTRCNGAGYFPQYKHVDAGICFRCLGNCIEKTIFTERLTTIKKNRSSYQINKIMNDSYTFLESIDDEIYKNVISKVYDIPSKAIFHVSDDDLPW